VEAKKFIGERKMKLAKDLNFQDKVLKFN